MKILLLSPPAIHGFSRDARTDFVSVSDSHWHPIWLSYCGAVLEEYKHEVKLIDAPAAHLSVSEVLRQIIDFSPEFVLVYGSTKTQKNDIKFSQQIKDKINCRIIFVGPFATLAFKDILRESNTVDAVIRREFEYPALEVADGVAWDKIKNLVWKKDGVIIENELRPSLSNEELDKLPFVSKFYKRHLNLKYYRLPSEPFTFVSINYGRGCAWGKCSFCLWYPHFLTPGQYNTRSLSSVIEELKFIEKELPKVKVVVFQDDDVTKEKARELADAIIRNNLKISWSCYSRADLDFNTLKLMKTSGCRFIYVGYESADQNILNKAHKGIKVEDMVRFTKEAQRVGLRIYANFVVGLPGETKETIKKTVQWIKKLRQYFAKFCVMNIYTNTSLYQYLKENNYIKNEKVNYPHLSYKELHKADQQAYRDFYFSAGYLTRVVRHPWEYFFSQIRPIMKTIPNIFWRKPW